MQTASTKRGGDQLRPSLTEAERPGHKPEVESLALDDALTQMETTNPQHSRIMELSFFGGLTPAQVMSLSQASTDRY